MKTQIEIPFEVKDFKKLKLWSLRKGRAIYSSRKNVYIYDFGIIVIKGANGEIHIFSTNSDDAINIIYSDKNNYRIYINNLNRNIEYVDPEIYFVYLERDNQATIGIVNKKHSPNMVCSKILPLEKKLAYCVKKL